mmetsp:Transcript_48004/g.154879  ORF Transcript_48004/g.154879 Transcript_48004/m.154879 type:complete len:288 (-) Transcript_48004:81-944(-)
MRCSPRSLSTGNTLRLEFGSLQIQGGSIAVGCLFCLRRDRNIIYLFMSEEQARNEQDWNGVLPVSAGMQAMFRVVGRLWDRETRPDGTFAFGLKTGHLSGSGVVLQEMLLENGSSWMKVQCEEPQQQPPVVGWVGPIYRGGKGTLRITRPFPLDLQLYCLQYDNFQGDVAPQLELVMELKPDRSDKQVVDAELLKEGQWVARYTLRFRERSFRNAYWRTMQTTLRGRLTLEHHPPVAAAAAANGVAGGGAREPWLQNPTTTLRLELSRCAGPGAQASCLVRIWDQPR